MSSEVTVEGKFGKAAADKVIMKAATQRRKNMMVLMQPSLAVNNCDSDEMVLMVLMMTRVTNEGKR